MDSVGVMITRVVEEVTIRPPRPDEVTSLDIPSGVHVFDILRTFATDERPVETANIVIPGDRYALVYAFRVTEDEDDPVTS
jgi:GntR family transcriptional regulator